MKFGAKIQLPKVMSDDEPLLPATKIQGLPVVKKIQEIGISLTLNPNNPFGISDPDFPATPTHPPQPQLSATSA